MARARVANSRSRSLAFPEIGHTARATPEYRDGRARSSRAEQKDDGRQGSGGNPYENEPGQTHRRAPLRGPSAGLHAINNPWRACFDETIAGIQEQARRL